MTNNIFKSNKKIMLIEPPFYRLYHDQFCLVKYPLALGYLSGSILRKTKWEVQTYNADFNAKKKSFDPSGEYLSGKGFKRYLSSLKDMTFPIWDEIKKSIEEFNPSVIGLTVKSQNFTSGTIVAQIAKKINPEIKILVGGAHSTMNGTKVFECKDIDFACIGEGENTISDLLNTLENNRDLNLVDGIKFRENNKIITTKPRAYIDDLDTLDFALTTAPKVLKNFDRYPKRAFGYVFGSRGCPYACTFCESKAMWTRKVRYRSPENIISELKQMYEFGIRQVNFDDDTFGISKKNIKIINDLLEKELPDMTYTCETVVQLAKDEQVVKDMKRGGCTGTYVGIESGNNEMLKSIKKTQTTDECVQAIRNLQKHGIDSHAFIMVGFPNETEATFKQTMDFLPKLKPDNIIFSVFTPYPGSDLFYQCQKDGIIDGEFDLSIYNHQSPLNCFTKNISKERFYELRREADKFVDKYNQKAKFRRGIAALRNLGIKATFRKVYSHYYSRVIARINA
jgi:anaerobic magnesium-protoporphyrin IX monomethyl ester cyclase